MIANDRITHSCGCSEHGPCPTAAQYFRRSQRDKIVVHLEHTMLVDGVTLVGFLQRREVVAERARLTFRLELGAQR